MVLLSISKADTCPKKFHEWMKNSLNNDPYARKLINQENA